MTSSYQHCGSGHFEACLHFSGGGHFFVRSASILDGKQNVSSAPVVLFCSCVGHAHYALFVCLFELFIYVPSKIFQLNRDGFS